MSPPEFVPVLRSAVTRRCLALVDRLIVIRVELPLECRDLLFRVP
jgi:hypothetical protein